MNGSLQETLGDTLPAVAPERIVPLRDGTPRDGGRYVLYWMQSSQRPWDNPALNLAIISANRLHVPVLVCFALTGYPEATVRHYTFMLEGIAETARLLRRRGMDFVMRCGEPWEFARDLSRDAAFVVTDGAYLPLPRSWRATLAEKIDCPLYEVESDVVVPVRIASDKREFAARTIRKKLHRHVEQFLREPANPEPDVRAPEPGLAGELAGALDPSDPAAVVDTVVATYGIDTSVHPVSRLYPGGPEVALNRFSRFLENSLASYSAHRNKPETDDTSGMSMHLQYGQISPVRLLVEAARFRDSRHGQNPGAGGQNPGAGSDGAAGQAPGAGGQAPPASSDGAAGQNPSAGGQAPPELAEQYDDFFEELLVRRELAYNYCFYEPACDTFEALPDWAGKTLAEHAHDERAPLYSLEELEAGETEDEYWNACTKEMRETGYMHNYVRMYWGKQVLRWSPTPEEAFRRVLAMNNRYFLDGLNPASYANVGWIFGLHDRPWTERAIFGKVRIMTPGGLTRKCNMPAYIAKVDRLAKFVRQ